MLSSLTRARLPARSALVVLLASLTALAGCSDEDATSDDTDALRTDPGAIVATTDPALRLLNGYNALVDRATTMPCVEPVHRSAPQVGDVRGTFYMQQITSREDLARELDVDVGVTARLPEGSIDAASKVVKTFSQSAMTVSFLVRAARSYVVSNTSDLRLTADALSMLRGRRTDEFITKCGGSFAKSIRYEAQVVALLQYEVKSQESARSIEAALGGTTPKVLKQLTSASAEVKTTAEELARQHDAKLSLSITAIGFVSPGKTAGTTVESTFEQIDELRSEMAASFEGDLARDRAGYDQNNTRYVRPAAVGQGTYAQVGNAPSGAVFQDVTSRLTRAEEFVEGISKLQLRMEAVHADEVGRFLSDTENQFRYNLASEPKLRTSDLVPIAQKWDRAFASGDLATPTSLVAPLQHHVERCLAAAGNGDFGACATTRTIEDDKRAAENALASYVATGRIVPMDAWMPRVEKRMSYRNADDECRALGLRLPKREEMPLVGPTVTAQAGAPGEVWFAGDAQCAKPFFKNDVGQGVYGCGANVIEPLPFASDRPVVCVGRSGPLVVLPTR